MSWKFLCWLPSKIVFPSFSILMGHISTKFRRSHVFSRWSHQFLLQNSIDVVNKYFQSAENCINFKPDSSGHCFSSITDVDYLRCCHRKNVFKNPDTRMLKLFHYGLQLLRWRTSLQTKQGKIWKKAPGSDGPSSLEFCRRRTFLTLLSR